MFNTLRRKMGKTLNTIINHFGLEFIKADNTRLHNTMRDMFAHVSKFDFKPKTVIDIGVAHGTFDLYEAYPKAFFLLIEPLEEFKESIDKILHKYNGNVVFAAAYSKQGQLEFNVHNDHLDGSSLLKEQMGPEVDGTVRIIPTVTVDSLVRSMNLNSSFLLKIDVQGGEVDVLEGAKETLKNTELVVLEVSLFEFMKGAPSFFNVVNFMNNMGFVTYDIFGGTVRPLDGALAQIDMVFVKENGVFRKNHAYATIDQWKNRNA